jgi:hypothetical protein
LIPTLEQIVGALLAITPSMQSGEAVITARRK